VLWFALSLGCSRHRQLTPPAECKDAQLMSCLQPLSFETLGASALARVQREGEACFSKDPAVLRRQSSCLPLLMGEDAQGRGKVSMKYYCSDLCPDQGGVVAEFEDLRNVEACCAAGGQPILDGAWGGFRACVVPRGPNPSKLCRTKE
jgi:hypothetical protein